MSTQSMVCGLAALAVTGVLAANAQAATIASDSAADAAYSDATMNARNGGTGFGVWNVVVSAGSAWGGSYVTANDPANTNTPAFQIYVASNGVVDAYRSTGGALASGRSIVLTGLILSNSPTGGEGGFALTDSANTPLIKVYAKGNDGPNGYYVDDATGTHALANVGYNWHYKLDFTFALGDAGAYALSAAGVIPATDTTPAIPVSGSYSGTLSTVTGGITQFDLLAKHTSDGGEVYLESMAVTTVPEPTSIALLGLASISLLSRRRRA